jgi:vitellogenic carboxypeptidase-like protein
MLIILFLICFINAKKTNRNCTPRDSLVKTLPGLGEDVPCMYSGFIEIDEASKSNIFYWLIEAKKSSVDLPLIIWLNGGPGSSSLIGLFTEMGPLRFNKTADKVMLKEDKSWTSVANVLYVDQPVGTGFSYTADANKMATNQQTVSIHFYKFIQKFLSEYTNYQKRDVYIIGESYAGKYIPNIAKKILDENRLIEKDERSHIRVNLKKIAIGNGLFDSKYQRAARKDLAKGINIMSEHNEETQYDMLVKNCEFSVANNRNDSIKHCDEVIDYIKELAGDVYEMDVRKNRFYDKDLSLAMEKFLNLDEVATALHVKGHTIKTTYWSKRNETVRHALADDINLKSSLPVLEDILDNYELPIIIYAGQFDLVDGPQGIERSLYSLNNRFIENFKKSPRELWKVNTTDGSVVAGYVRQYDKLIFITMRNAGHFAPRDAFYSSLDMLRHLFSDEKSWKCPDDSCSLIEKKCQAMKKCNNNGVCNASTGGQCVCNDDFYGPDCSIKATEIDNFVIRISPRDTKVLKLSNYEGDMLLEIESDDHNILVSLLNKLDHHQLFNQKDHIITYRLLGHKLVLFIEKHKFDEHLVVITNQEFEHEIELKIFLNSYSKYN